MGREKKAESNIDMSGRGKGKRPTPLPESNKAKKRRMVYDGLVNLAFNCYLISFLQMTFMIKPFVNFMKYDTMQFGNQEEEVRKLNNELSNDFKTKPCEDDVFLRSVKDKLKAISSDLKLQSLVVLQLVHMYNVLNGDELRCEQGKDVDYLRFLLWAWDRDGVGRFHRNSQEDPHEVLCCCIAIAPGCENSFSIEITQTLKCRNCGQKRKCIDKVDTIRMTSFPNIEGISSHLSSYEGEQRVLPDTKCENKDCGSDEQTGGKTLKEIISRTSPFAIVTAETAAWNYEKKCAEKVVTTLPPALRIHTRKRFKKLSVDKKALPNKALMAVIVHAGKGPDGGHFMTYKQVGNDVVHIDDNRLTIITNTNLGDFADSKLKKAAHFISLYN